MLSVSIVMSEVWSLSALNITNCRPVGLPYSDKSYTKLAEMKSWWWMMKCYIDCLQSPVFLSQPAVNNGKYLIRGREGGGGGDQTPVSPVSERSVAQMRRFSAGSASVILILWAGLLLRLQSEALHKHQAQLRGSGTCHTYIIVIMRR